jgi:hypothetical protein
MKIKRQTLGQSGSSAIEFALVLPVLIVLLFGIVEFGVLFYDKAMITNASREGARLGVVHVAAAGCTAEGNKCHPLNSEITKRVNDYLGVTAGVSSLLISFGAASSLPSTSVELPDGDDFPGQRLRVTVSYEYGWLLLPNFVTDLGFDNKLLTATSEMRFE